MISRVLLAVVILVFAIAHGLALHKIQAIEDAHRAPSAATITNGD